MVKASEWQLDMEVRRCYKSTLLYTDNMRSGTADKFENGTNVLRPHMKTEQMFCVHTRAF